MALILLAGAGYAYYKQNSMEVLPPLDEEIDLEGTAEVSFLPIELSSGLFKNSFGTITFFEGNYETVAPLWEARVKAIRKANPWLGGWLVAPGQHPKTADFNDVTLWFDPSGEQMSPGAFHCHEPGEIPLTERTPYSLYNDLCEDFRLKVRSIKYLLGKNTPLWRVCIVPDAAAPTEKFAVVVSLNHMLGDSYTLLSLYQMLDLSKTDKEAVKVMNPFRKVEYPEEVARYLGEYERTYLRKANDAFWERNSVPGETASELLLFTINEKWLEQQREVLETDPLDDAVYVTSWFFAQLKPEVAAWSHSLRDQLDCITSYDAGNYINPIPYTIEDYVAPVKMLKALETGKRPSQDVPLPMFPQSFGLAADWARMGVGNLIGEKYGEQVTHFPVVSTEDLQCFPKKLSGLIVFQASPTELGAICVVPKEAVERITSSEVFGEILPKFH